MYRLYTRRWKPKENLTREESLLRKYCAKFGGVTYAEVRLDDDDSPKRSRIVDAVRFLRHKKVRRIITYRAKDKGANPLSYKERLKEANQKGEMVQAIEVKRQLNRSVIGQVMVAEWLLKKKRKKLRVMMVVVCETKLERLEEFCREHRIKVWSPTTKVRGN
jgi:hypothetical protein